MRGKVGRNENGGEDDLVGDCRRRFRYQYSEGQRDAAKTVFLGIAERKGYFAGGGTQEREKVGIFERLI